MGKSIVEKELLKILNHNSGFDSPYEWLLYAEKHNFRKVESTGLGCCPDCRSSNRSKIGQQVYYSTLMSFMECCNCGLIYSDTHLNEDVIKSHFESAYKDHEYFLVSRAAIFQQISNMVNKCSPQGAKVIDIGGAEGHLLSLIHKDRFDLDLTLNDISEKACKYAHTEFDLKTICSPMKNLSHVDQKFDILLLIDIIYYEPDIIELWNSISYLTDVKGTLIIRLPNRYPLIILYQKIRRIFIRSRNDMSDSIRFLNPEHIYIFSKNYLKKRLEGMGFNSIVYIPSTPMKLIGVKGFIVGVYYLIAKLIGNVTAGWLIITPSFFVVAKRLN